jgi:hypothetical protein
MRDPAPTPGTRTYPLEAMLAGQMAAVHMGQFRFSDMVMAKAMIPAFGTPDALSRRG